MQYVVTVDKEDVALVSILKNRKIGGGGEVAQGGGCGKGMHVCRKLKHNLVLIFSESNEDKNTRLIRIEIWTPI